MDGTRTGTSSLIRRLTAALEGDIRDDLPSRGRYATDASFYQVVPAAVALPRTEADVACLLEIAREEGASVTPRGAGTSQAGQAVGQGVVVDTSRHLDRILELDRDARTVTVEPGVVLDRLNAFLAPHGLFFPVDVATSSRATLGGMAGNNSAGARSLRYGLFADNVVGIRARLADGTDARFGPAGGPDVREGPGGRAAPGASEVAAAAAGSRGAAAPGRRGGGGDRAAALTRAMLEIRRREADELARRIPPVLRHVAGYNLHRLAGAAPNLAELLVGSEGTLAFFTELTLRLAPLPERRVLGVCAFHTLRDALDAVQHIVELGPTAVELMDATLLERARSSRRYAADAGRFVTGEPGALLLVEFSGPGADGRALDRLDAVLAEVGGAGAAVRAEDAGFQALIWGVRKAALNLVMSEKRAARPVSFIEDCAIPLDRLAEYGDRLTAVFRRHGTPATWYAHASVGCLHVRPALNLKDGADLGRMRAIAEEAHAIVRELGGSHSGEHGDGMLRSEFLEPMLGSRLTRAFADVKAAFDPEGLLNPGKIVRPPRMDDPSLTRYPPGYGPLPLATRLDWSDWDGLTGAVEMCNNNGACRKLEGGTMCPSFRATREEEHSTRGRANTLRLALTGQLGPDAFTSDALHGTLSLCVGCKACRRECPTGVDMARMKTEFLSHYHERHGLPLRERLVAYLPRYAPAAARLAPLLNLRNRSAGLRWLGEKVAGLAAGRSLPEWRRPAEPDDRRPTTDDRRPGVSEPPGAEQAARGRPASPGGRGASPEPSSVVGRRSSVAPRSGAPVALFIDTFTRYFEPENARAATTLLEAAGYDVVVPAVPGERRPPCCGRTFLNAGLVEEARVEARRLVAALRPWVERGAAVVGLEPSCLLTLRDELTVLLPASEVGDLPERAVTLEELLVAERAAGRLALDFAHSDGRALVHPHCHQKAFNADASVVEALGWIPGLRVERIEAGCCGMAGSFGYEAEHHEVSLRMAELELAPAVRAAPSDARIIADGTSCRHQIRDVTGREAVHAAVVLAEALAGDHR